MLGLAQHPYKNRTQHPVLLAVDQQLGEGGLGDCSLDLHRKREYRRASQRGGDMIKRSALAIALLVGLLVVATAAPAHAAPRLRLYRGETSQGERISFTVAKNDAGRFVRQVSVFATLSCEDQTTTLPWGVDSFLAPREVPVTDRAFSYDVNLGNVALVVTGGLGSLRGEGTASMIAGGLTSDKQAQLCTTGDLTWTVQFVRTL